MVVPTVPWTKLLPAHEAVNISPTVPWGTGFPFTGVNAGHTKSEFKIFCCAVCKGQIEIWSSSPRKIHESYNTSTWYVFEDNN